MKGGKINMPFIVGDRVVNPNSLNHYYDMKARNITWIPARNLYPNGTYFIRDSGKKFFEGYYAEDIGIFITESESLWIARTTGKTIEAFSYSQLEKLLEHKKEIDNIINEGENK